MDWGDVGNIGGAILGGPLGYAGSQVAQHGVGGTVGNILFGGLGKSTNPNDYQVTNPMGGQINGMLGQGAAQLDPMQQAQFRAMQIQQAQQLQRIASGQQQGAGELAAQRQVGNAIAAQQAQMRMARGGGNAGMAMLNGARQSANIGLAGSGQAQQAAMQDQMNAQQMLGNTLGQGRGQDIGFAGQNAGLQQQQYGQNLNALTGLNAQDLQAQSNAMNAATGQQGIAGGLITTAGTMLAHSDENLKTDIKDASAEIDAMMDRLRPTTYRYKDEAKHGRGERAGIMAQDLLKSTAGSHLVESTPDGLAFDVGKAVSAALASTARLNERLRKVEQRG